MLFVATEGLGENMRQLAALTTSTTSAVSKILVTGERAQARAASSSYVAPSQIGSVSAMVVAIRVSSV